jgi:hypothetical protein
VQRSHTFYSLGDRLLVEHADAAALAVGEEVTLMGWGNCIIDAVATGKWVLRLPL